MTDNEKLLLLGIGVIAVPLLFSRKNIAKAIDTTTLTPVEKRVLSYADYVESASAEFDIPKSLIYAIIEQESGGRADITGKAEEYGLMQVMCPTARDMGFTGLCYELYNPEINIFYGCKYLRWQYNRYGDVYQAISAYNAGSYTSTNKGYVNSVSSLWKKYADIVRQFASPEGANYLGCLDASFGKIDYNTLAEDVQRVSQYWQNIVVESQSKGLDPCVVAGLIHKESQGHADKEYHGAYGLMQLKASTAREFGLRGDVKNLYLPSENIRIGANYLLYLFRRYRGDYNKIISAYQAGHVTGRNKPYVKDVTDLRRIYCNLSISHPGRT